MQRLFGGDGFAEGPPDIGEDEHIDDAEGVAELHPVMDADSSQTLAVLDVIKGRNLVIQGLKRTLAMGRPKSGHPITRPGAGKRPSGPLGASRGATFPGT